MDQWENKQKKMERSDRHRCFDHLLLGKDRVKDDDTTEDGWRLDSSKGEKKEKQNFPVGIKRVSHYTA